MISSPKRRLLTLDAYLAVGWDPCSVLRVLQEPSRVPVVQRLAAYLGCSPEIAQEICCAPLDTFTPQRQDSLREEAMRLRDELEEVAERV